jgi:hypothetical protein
VLKRGLAVWVFCTILLQHLPLNAQGAGKINIVIVEGEGAINNVRQRVARERVNRSCRLRMRIVNPLPALQ